MDVANPVQIHCPDIIAILIKVYFAENIFQQLPNLQTIPHV